MHDEHKFFKSLNEESFIIYKNNSKGTLIFQSSIQAKIMNKYNEDLFFDGTFYISLQKWLIKYLLKV